MRIVASHLIAWSITLGWAPYVKAADKPAASYQADHSRASIRGMRAVGFWPDREGEIVDPKPYEVVLSPGANPEQSIRLPAGTWQLPAEGAYWVVLEGPFEISPWPGYVNWSIKRYEGRGLAVSQRVVPAGRVQMAAPCPVKSCTAWLLHATSNIQTPVPWFTTELLRRVPLAKAIQQGVLMPGGRISVALYDSSTNDFLALQSPITVTPGKTIDARPEVPRAGRASLILELARPSAVLQRPDDDIGLALVTHDDKQINPSLITRTHRKVIAIWHDAPAGAARVELKSSKWRLPQAELRLRSGKIEHATLDLAALPTLGLTLEIPEALPASEKHIVITDLSGQTEPIEKTLDSETNHLAVIVPAAAVKVTLTTGPWSVTERFDLSDGADRSAILKMQLIRVTGRVYYGKEPTNAELTFDTRTDWEDSLKIETDSEGDYEALLVRPGVYSVLVNLKDRDAPYPIPGHQIESDMTLDFVVPANRYTFRVTDRTTGNPVSGARVAVNNEADDADRMTVRMILKTEADGTASAQPLRAGRMKVVALADGFSMSEPHEEPVVADGERLISFTLDRVSSEALTLLLPNGSPASAAEVLINPGSPSASVLRADRSGRVQVPRTAAGSLLLVKTGEAALLARRWPGEEQTWRLDPPSPQPLVLRGVHESGKVTRAAAILWLDGVRLSTEAAAWLTSTPGGTDSDGLWIVRGLPARPLEVLLWKSTAENFRLVPTGLLDSMRKAIPYPWPAQVDVKVLE